MIRSTSSFIRDSYGYPTSDGKPMAETDQHRMLMMDLIFSLSQLFINNPDVYVSGNLLLHYVPGDRRRHVSPDVFVVRGIPKGIRPNYLTWIEGKGPDMVIELTSSSTRRADTRVKFALYRDVLCVPEYFLFDPRDDYLEPRLQGYRLVDGQYVSIAPVEGRLPSTVIGLHLEAAGENLRLWQPQMDSWLPTPVEAVGDAREQADQALEDLREANQARRLAEEEASRKAEQTRLAEKAQRAAEKRATRLAEEKRLAEEETARLRRENEELRRRPNPPPAEQP
jgi:Uma2 family endonuclease